MRTWASKGNVRSALLNQEIERVNSKLEYHGDRIKRKVEDTEDFIAYNLYARILTALRGMVI